MKLLGGYGVDKAVISREFYLHLDDLIDLLHLVQNVVDFLDGGVRQEVRVDLLGDDAIGRSRASGIDKLLDSRDGGGMFVSTRAGKDGVDVALGDG